MGSESPSYVCRLSGESLGQAQASSMALCPSPIPSLSGEGGGGSAVSGDGAEAEGIILDYGKRLLQTSPQPWPVSKATSFLPLTGTAGY